MPPRSNSFGYFAALKDKHQRLNTTASPKIIFVGGSNLAFGLDSATVEKRFHRPVVNMGLCAPFGLRYMLEEVKDHINRGDTIILVPEYGIIQNSVDGSADIIHAIEVYPPSALFILRACLKSSSYLSNLTNLAATLPAIKWKSFTLLMEKMIKQGDFNLAVFNDWELSESLELAPRSYFNKQGDFLGHLAKANKPYTPNWEIVKTMCDEAAVLLNQFDQFARQHGARVVLVPAPIPREYLGPGMCSAQSISRWPDKTLSIPVLAGPIRYSLAAKYFYETPYHLNLLGRTKRTALLIEDLKPFLNINTTKL